MYKEALRLHKEKDIHWLAAAGLSHASISADILPNLQICEHNNMLFYGLKYEGACFTAADNHSCHSSLVPEIQGIRKPTFYILIRHLTLTDNYTRCLAKCKVLY